MSDFYIQASTLTNVANAIRSKISISNTMTPIEMTQYIMNIPTGDTTVKDLIEKECSIIYNKTCSCIGLEFRSNFTLREIYLDSATTIYTDAFRSCTNLSLVSLPNVTGLYGSAFDNCTKLTTVYCPKVRTLYSYVFNNCTALSEISLPSATTISSAAFSKCTHLSKVYLMGSSVVKLNSYPSTVFPATCNIYVPSSLYNSYLGTASWSYYTSQLISI